MAAFNTPLKQEDAPAAHSSTDETHRRSGGSPSQGKHFIRLLEQQHCYRMLLLLTPCYFAFFEYGGLEYSAVVHILCWTHRKQCLGFVKQQSMFIL